jgi:hypothetical protein
MREYENWGPVEGQMNLLDEPEVERCKTCGQVHDQRWILANGVIIQKASDALRLDVV